MSKHVNGLQLSKSMKNEKGSVLLLSGAFSKQMMTYAKQMLEEKPGFTILHTGINDVGLNTDLQLSANSIFDIVVTCKKNGLEVK